MERIHLSLSVDFLFASLLNAMKMKCACIHVLGSQSNLITQSSHPIRNRLEPMFFLLISLPLLLVHWFGAPQYVYVQTRTRLQLTIWRNQIDVCFAFFSSLKHSALNNRSLVLRVHIFVSNIVRIKSNKHIIDKSNRISNSSYAHTNVAETVMRKRIYRSSFRYVYTPQMDEHFSA